MAMTNVFTGAHGALVMMQGGTAAEAADTQPILNAYEVFEIGRVVGATVRVDTDLEEFYEVGRRHPVSLNPGDIHISGTIERAYINGTLLYLLLGRGASPTNVDEATTPYPQPTMHMNVVLQDPATPTNRAILDVFDLKFENWGFTLPEDDFVLEKLRFRALRLNVRDEEGGELKNVTFPEANGA